MKSTSKASNFAANQLKKFGWKEGDGIGKTNQGIAKPIKASLKFDNSGLGFNQAEEFTNNWWDQLFDSTAKAIEENRPDIKINDDDHTKKSESPLTRKSYFYSRFEKASTLLDGRNIETPELDEEKQAKKKKQRKSQDDETTKTILSDEDLFKLCQGRTAHKGARHGIKMNGKLSRIQEQEKVFIDLMHKQKTNSSDSSDSSGNEQPIKAKKKKVEEKSAQLNDEEDENNRQKKKKSL